MRQRVLRFSVYPTENEEAASYLLVMKTTAFKLLILSNRFMVDAFLFISMIGYYGGIPRDILLVRKRTRK